MHYELYLDSLFLLNFGMNLLLIPAAWVDFVSGLLLIVVLIIDRLTSGEDAKA